MVYALEFHTREVTHKKHEPPQARAEHAKLTKIGPLKLVCHFQSKHYWNEYIETKITLLPKFNQNSRRDWTWNLVLQTTINNKNPKHHSST